MQLRKYKMKDLYKYAYRNKVDRLNELYQAIASAEMIDKKGKKNG